MEGSSNYHIPIVLRLNGSLSVSDLELSLRAIVERHEVLRTAILEDSEGVGYQEVFSSKDFKLSLESLNDGESIGDYTASKIREAFDLSKAYKLRASVLELTSQEFVLVCVLHHIAFDGWSTPIFFRELLENYKVYTNGLELSREPLNIQ